MTAPKHLWRWRPRALAASGDCREAQRVIEDALEERWDAALAIAPTRAAHVELAQLFDQLEESALAVRHCRAAALL